MQTTSKKSYDFARGRKIDEFRRFTAGEDGKILYLTIYIVMYGICVNLLKYNMKKKRRQ